MQGKMFDLKQKCVLNSKTVRAQGRTRNIKGGINSEFYTANTKTVSFDFLRIIFSYKSIKTKDFLQI